MRNVAYRLDLPANLQIHKVFYVSLRRDHKLQVGEETPDPPPLRLAIDPEVWASTGRNNSCLKDTNKSAVPICVTIQNRREGIRRAELGTCGKSEATSSIKTISKCLVMPDSRSAMKYF